MIEQPFFTIVMPAYNVGNVLGRAVNSLLQQTYTKFEVIIVNDGSQDNTKDIAEQFVQQDARINLINLSCNQGPADARNEGISRAKGAYLTFLDADDFIDINTLAIYAKYIEWHNPDLIKVGLIEEYYNEDASLVHSKECRYQSLFERGQENIAKYVVELETIPLFGYSWNSVYKTQIIRDNCLLFDPCNVLQEDFMFNLQYYKLINSIQIIDFMPCHYIKDTVSGSLSDKFVKEYWTIYSNKITTLCDYYRAVIPQDALSWSKTKELYVRYVFSALVRFLDTRHGKTDAELAGWLVALSQTRTFVDLAPYPSTGRFVIRRMSSYLFGKNIAKCITIAKIIKHIKGRYYTAFLKIK